MSLTPVGGGVIKHPDGLRSNQKTIENLWMVCRVSRPDDLSSVWMISKVSGSSKLCLAGVKYLDDPSDLKSFQMIWKVFTWLFRDNFKFGPKNDQKRSKTRPSKQCKSLIWILVFVFPVLIRFRKLRQRQLWQIINYSGNFHLKGNAKLLNKAFHGPLAE